MCISVFVYLCTYLEVHHVVRAAAVQDGDLPLQGAQVLLRKIIGIWMVRRQRVYIDVRCTRTDGESVSQSVKRAPHRAQGHTYIRRDDLYGHGRQGRVVPVLGAVNGAVGTLRGFDWVVLCCIVLSWWWFGLCVYV